MSLDSFKTEDSKSVKHSWKQASGGEMFQKPSSEKAYIVGTLICDGSVFERSDGAKMMELAATDEEFVAEFGQSFCLLTGLNWSGLKDDKTEVSVSVKHKESDEHRTVYHMSKGVTTIYSQLKKYTVMGSTQLLNEFEGYEPSLLRGLWDSEGTVDKNDFRLGFTNQRGEVKDLYCELLNIVLDIDNPEDEVHTYWAKDSNCFRVTLPAKYSQEFMNRVNPTADRKTDIVEQMQNDSDVYGGE